MNDAVISARNVGKCYRVFDNETSRLTHAIYPKYTKGVDEIWALNEVSFDIGRGEAVAIIGRNGGGKSTLLEILTGTLTPTTGEVKVNGRVSALLELGSGFNPEYSGRDNVILNGLLLGLRRDEILSRFGEIEAFAEIGTAIDRPVKTYSSGMMMRLAFAVQVLCNPDILIIDEALSVGDFFFQQKCLAYIRGLCSRGVTLLFVSHDMGTVRDLCPRVILLKQGRLLFDGASGDGIPLFFRDKSLPGQTPIGAGTPDVRVLKGDNQLDAIRKKSIWVRGDGGLNDTGVICSVAFLDEQGSQRSAYKIGEKLQVTVAYIPHPGYENHISVGLTNKYGHLTTMTGSSQLGVSPPRTSVINGVVFFDLWLTLLLEAGYYSVTVTLGYESGVNVGERLDQVLNLGPVQVVWDYTKDCAPFIGQCGLPAEARFWSAPL